MNDKFKDNEIVKTIIGQAVFLVDCKNKIKKLENKIYKRKSNRITVGYEK